MEDEDYTSRYPEKDRAPDKAFSHTDAAIDSGIREGMIVEIPLEETSNFWLAKILKVFGPLLQCTYVSSETESGGKGIRPPFWMDLSKKDYQIYPLGYCQMNKIQLKPPEDMRRDRSFDWEEVALRYLEDVSYDTVPMHLMEPCGGTTPAERLKPGMVLDIRDNSRPRVYWSAVILSNTGGLLRFAYDVPENISSSFFEISLFYLSDRLMRCNFKDRKRIFEPPPFIKNAFKTTKWKDFRTQLGSLDRPNPPKDLIRSKKQRIDDDPLDHFDEESLVEVVHPRSLKTLELGVIDKVEKNVGVVVKLFLEPNVKIIRSPMEVFPVGWSQGSELSVTRSISLENKLPGNYSLALKKCFLKPRKIIAIKEPLLWVELVEHPSKIKILIPSNAHDIYPLGWAFANNIRVANRPILSLSQSIPSSPVSIVKVNDEPVKTVSNSFWCNAIYINCNCSSLGFLSKKRLLSLPKSIGPGSVRLVLREILSKLIGLSFKSGSILKRLEYDESKPPRKNFTIETLKGKSKVLNLKGQVEIPTLASDVDEYCQEVCSKVGACPYLISTKLYEDTCPASCKTMEVQVGRPRKKRGYPIHQCSNNAINNNVPNQEDSSPSSLEETDDNTSQNNSRCVTPEPRKKHNRKEWSELLPKSDIQTRGAKLPNWKLHLKIRPSKKDQKTINNNALRESLGYFSSNLSKRCKQLEPAFKVDDIPIQEEISSDDTNKESNNNPHEHNNSISSNSEPPIRIVRLRRNPSLWTPDETAHFLAQTADCAHLARFMYEDQIDGPAFLLLNFPIVKEYWSLKTDSAVQLCQHVESVKLAYMKKFYD
nr:scm-like with four MBT domains protein 2 [Lepeophtheirus salmonis]